MQQVEVQAISFEVLQTAFTRGNHSLMGGMMGIEFADDEHLCPRIGTASPDGSGIVGMGVNVIVLFPSEAIK
jgi:hypothetical protein